MKWNVLAEARDRIVLCLTTSEHRCEIARWLPSQLMQLCEGSRFGRIMLSITTENAPWFAFAFTYVADSKTCKTNISFRYVWENGISSNYIDKYIVEET